MANRIEREFRLALALRCNEWGLGDNGYSDTVLVCERCDHEEVFPDRESATGFLNNGEVCEECGHEKGGDRCPTDGRR